MCHIMALEYEAPAGKHKIAHTHKHTISISATCIMYNNIAPTNFNT